MLIVSRVGIKTEPKSGLELFKSVYPGFYEKYYFVLCEHWTGGFGSYL